MASPLPALPLREGGPYEGYSFALTVPCLSLGAVDLFGLGFESGLESLKNVVLLKTPEVEARASWS